eukprot:TRINITY_DN27394_c0_g4_i1.p1 TRINITY_DN27394_c0_g4~~TRINITY_DN27394_c0_g4_i1.p1  ORF type:complete len:106 (-),score=0.20 TRINITY_DN27394_c0_g4_i1:106-423(-)
MCTAKYVKNYFLRKNKLIVCMSIIAIQHLKVFLLLKGDTIYLSVDRALKRSNIKALMFGEGYHGYHLKWHAKHHTSIMIRTSLSCSLSWVTTPLAWYLPVVIQGL